MFRSILVPLDGAAESEEALTLARTVAESTGGSLYLFLVSPFGSSAVSDASATYLERIAADLRLTGVPAQAATASGEPAIKIAGYAHAHAMDLIVMATHAGGPHSILALTSVTQEVLTRSPCPVLLVRAGSKQPCQIRTLLVPVDGSPGGSLALAAARALARATASQLLLVDVVVPVPAATFAALPGMTVGGYIDPEWEELARTAARTYVEAVARRLRESGMHCEARVSTGEVPGEILRCADEVDADMIVMSTHSATWPARAYVGSVADYVLRHGSRPVLLVRREPSTAESTSDAPSFTDFATAQP